ncbi:MAG: hypothetical protein II508_01815 [Acholeplasmatales bacterium]|nr:hypothetical protein [Acholeplasmatales bacterium]
MKYSPFSKVSVIAVLTVSFNSLNPFSSLETVYVNLSSSNCSAGSYA